MFGLKYSVYWHVMNFYLIAYKNQLLKNTKNSLILNVCCVLVFCLFCAVRCVCFCTGTFVMVPLNFTCLQCFNILFLNISSIYILNGPFYYTCVRNPHVSFRIVKNNENGDFTPESFELYHYSSCFTKPDSFTTLLYLVIRYQHTVIVKKLEMTE